MTPVTSLRGEGCLAKERLTSHGVKGTDLQQTKTSINLSFQPTQGNCQGTWCRCQIFFGVLLSWQLKLEKGGGPYSLREKTVPRICVQTIAHMNSFCPLPPPQRRVVCVDIGRWIMDWCWITVNRSGFSHVLQGRCTLPPHEPATSAMCTGLPQTLGCWPGPKVCSKGCSSFFPRDWVCFHFFSILPRHKAWPG